MHMCIATGGARGSLTDFCFASLVFSYVFIVFYILLNMVTVSCEYVLNSLVKAFGTLV